VERWSYDCVTLIGDAAHPMQPIGSQAVLDARALTAALLMTQSRHCNATTASDGRR
jgi:2-polyprenyl-6-methoxyphenol hydroxylase-like FAD-dependent oxidoreductase